MEDKNMEKMIYEMLSRQNKAFYDKFLPMLEECQDRLSELEKACVWLAHQNLDKRMILLNNQEKTCGCASGTWSSRCWAGTAG